MPDERLDWERIHARLTELARAQATLDFEQAGTLLEALRGGVHERLGYGSFLEYLDRLFGWGLRVASERVRVAVALEDLPRIGAALAAGELAAWSAVRELTRVAVPETEAAWLAVAQGLTVRQVEARVAGRRPGDRPSDPPDPGARRHIVRLEVSGATLALFREAQAKLARDAGPGRLSDDQVLELMARQVLGGPADEGRGSYQVQLTVCERCARAAEFGAGEEVPVTPEVVERAACDATHVGAGRAAQAIPPATRRRVLRRDRGRCVVPGCRHHVWVDVHHIRWRTDGGGHDEDNLCTLCSAHHAALHEGRLVLDGTPSTGLRFSHADGTGYGGQASPAEAALCADALSALRDAGLGREEAARAIAAARAHVGAGKVALEELLRQALIAHRRHRVAQNSRAGRARAHVGTAGRGRGDAATRLRPGQGGRAVDMPGVDPRRGPTPSDGRSRPSTCQRPGLVTSSATEGRVRSPARGGRVPARPCQPQVSGTSQVSQEGFRSVPVPVAAVPVPAAAAAPAAAPAPAPAPQPQPLPLPRRV